MKKIAVLQSNYIPWKGYFDLVNSVDEFFLYDSAQYTKNDWRNRNKIKNTSGLSWLSIPVRHESLGQRIIDTHAISNHWQKKHWKTIFQAYSKSKYFNDYKDIFESFYFNNKSTSLSSINSDLIGIVNSLLSIETKIRWSTEFDLPAGRSEKILSICQHAGASIYLSGPAAKNYLNVELMEQEGILVEWMDYNSYPEYKQLHPPFDHGVSILDLIFNEGPNAQCYMKSFGYAH